MGFTLLMRNRCFKGRYGGDNNHSDWTSFDFDGHKTLLDAAACFANSSTWVAVYVHWRVTSCSTQSQIMICKCQHHRLRCHLLWKTTRRAHLPFMAQDLTRWRTLSTVEFLSIMEVATWEPVSMHLWIQQRPYMLQDFQIFSDMSSFTHFSQLHLSIAACTSIGCPWMGMSRCPSGQRHWWVSRAAGVDYWWGLALNS